MPTKSINVSFISRAEEAPRAIMLMKVMNASFVSSMLGSGSSPHTPKQQHRLVGWEQKQCFTYLDET